MTLRAHRLASGPAGATVQVSIAADAVYRLLAAILPGSDLRDAACRGDNAHLWDDTRDVKGGEQPEKRAPRIEKAKTICRGCPEQAACLQRRLDNPALGAGVWGGQLFTRPGSEPRIVQRLETLPHLTALTHCQACGAPLPAEKQQKGARNCSEKCRKKAGTQRGKAGNTRPGPARTTCQNCNRPLNAQKQARRARNCSERCSRAAEVDRRRQRRTAATAADVSREPLRLVTPSASSPEVTAGRAA